MKSKQPKCRLAKASQHRDKCILAMSDKHTGHLVGLTPPSYRWSLGNSDLKSRAVAIQTECYNFYKRTVDALKPIDIVLDLGDGIEGDGHRSGGAELIIPDRSDQAKVSAQLSLLTEAPTYVMVRGTPYHGGVREEFENQIADAIREAGCMVKMGDHEWVTINGVTFDLKHKVRSSGVPAGRWGPMARSIDWSHEWQRVGDQPHADIFLRGHVHYHTFQGGADWPLGITMPALQGMGSRYGKKECEGRVHFGVISFHITAKGNYTWQAHIGQLESQRAHAYKL